MTNKFGTLLFLIAVVGLVFINTCQLLSQYDQQPTTKHFETVLPSAQRFEVDDATTYLTVGWTGNEEQGVALSSNRVPPVVRGYNGEMSLLVSVTPDGRIGNVLPLHHDETPAYFASLVRSGFFNAFKGRMLKDSFEDLDAISGATITSEAAKVDILSAARYAANTRYGFSFALPAEPARFQIEPVNLSLFILALLVGIIAAFRRTTPWRRAAWLLSVAVFGLWLNVSISMPQFIRLMHLGLPGGVQLEPLVLLAVALAFALGGRQVYCERLCPFGALQEIGYRLTPLALHPSGVWITRLRLLRWLILFSVVMLVAVWLWNPAAAFEPFGSLFTWVTPLPLMIFAIVVLIASTVFRRFWCRFFCPSGACLELCGKLHTMIPIPNIKNTSNPQVEEKHGKDHHRERESIESSGGAS